MISIRIDFVEENLDIIKEQIKRQIYFNKKNKKNAVYIIEIAY